MTGLKWVYVWLLLRSGLVPSWSLTRDLGYVEAPSGRCRQALVDIERVERVEAVIGVPRIGT